MIEENKNLKKKITYLKSSTKVLKYKKSKNISRGWINLIKNNNSPEVKIVRSKQKSKLTSRPVLMDAPIEVVEVIDILDGGNSPSHNPVIEPPEFFQ